MKYKVGDKVIIKSWSQLADEFGVGENGKIECKADGFSPSMDAQIEKRFPGRLLTVKRVEDEEDVIYGYEMEDFDAMIMEREILCLAKDYKEVEEHDKRRSVSRFDLMDFEDEI